MKSIPFDHNGKSYSLRMNINAMALASEYLDGEDTRTTIAEVRALDIRRVRALFAAALNVRLPLDAVGQMIEEIGIYEVWGLLDKAITDAVPLIMPKQVGGGAEKDGADAGNAKG